MGNCRCTVNIEGDVIAVMVVLLINFAFLFHFLFSLKGFIFICFLQSRVDIHVRHKIEIQYFAHHLASYMERSLSYIGSKTHQDIRF